MHYVNNSGRNDIVFSKVAVDKKYIYFHVNMANRMTTYSVFNWMLLFIDADKNPQTGWFGYNYLINQKVKDDNTTTLTKYNTSNNYCCIWIFHKRATKKAIQHYAR